MMRMICGMWIVSEEGKNEGVTSCHIGNETWQMSTDQFAFRPATTAIDTVVGIGY